MLWIEFHDLIKGKEVIVSLFHLICELFILEVGFFTLFEKIDLQLVLISPRHPIEDELARKSHSDFIISMLITTLRVRRAPVYFDIFQQWGVKSVDSYKD